MCLLQVADEESLEVSASPTPGKQKPPPTTMASNFIKTENNEKKKRNRSASEACEVCGKEFVYQKSFRKHKLDLHPDTTCVTCWKTFHLQRELEEHECTPIGPYAQQQSELKLKISLKPKTEKNVVVAVENDDRTGIFQCDICKKCYPDQEQLEEHEETHADDTSFTCHTCPKNFDTRDEFSTHVTACKPRLHCSKVMTHLHIYKPANDIMVSFLRRC